MNSGYRAKTQQDKRHLKNLLTQEVNTKRVGGVIGCFVVSPAVFVQAEEGIWTPCYGRTVPNIPLDRTALRVG